MMQLKPKACGLFYSANRFCEGRVQEATDCISLEIHLSYEKHSDAGLFSGSLYQVLFAVSSLKQVQLQQQDKTGFRLDPENAVRVQNHKSFDPLL